MSSTAIQEACCLPDGFNSFCRSGQTDSPPTYVIQNIDYRMTRVLLFCPHRHVSAVFLSLLLLAAAGFASQPFYPSQLESELQDTLLRQAITAEALEDTETHLTLELRNQALAEADGPTYHNQFFIQLPDGPVPKWKLVEAELHVIDQYGNVFPFDGKAWPLTEGAPTSWEKMIELRPLGGFRGRRLAGLNVHGTIKIPMAGRQVGLLHLGRVVIKLTYPTPDASASSEYVADFQDPLGQRFLQAIAINPGFPGGLNRKVNWPTFKEESRWVELLNKAATQAPLYKLTVYEPGLVKFDAREMQQLGDDPLQYNPSDFRLYCNGAEVPIFKPVQLSDNFTPGNHIYFLAPSDRTREDTYEEVFWLFPKGRELKSDPPMRIPYLGPLQVQRGVEQVDPQQVITLNATHTEVFRQKNSYNRNILPERGFSRWYWTSTKMGEQAELFFEPTNLKRLDKNMLLSMEVAIPKRRATGYAKVYLNGEQVGEHRFSRGEYSIIRCGLKPGQLKKGLNRVIVAYNGNRPDLSTDRLLIKALSLETGVELEGTASGVELVVSPATPVDVMEPSYVPLNLKDAKNFVAYDLSNAEALQPLPVVADADANYYIKLPPQHNIKHLALYNMVRGVLSPVVAQRPAPSSMQPGEGAEYLAVYHRDFQEGALRLARWHIKNNNYKARIVDVENFYDAFSYGRTTHKAIEAGLRFAAAYWTKPNPFFVTLIGESSEFGGNPAEVPNGAMPRFIPTFDIDDMHANIRRGDSRYARLTPGTPLPELALARLSVATPEELSAQLDKIERYATQPEYGPWMVRNLFVADDEQEFNAACRNLRAGPLKGISRAQVFEQRAFPYTTLHRVNSAKQSPVATEKLIEVLNQGTLTANYFGHGGPNIWSHERLLHLDDLGKLKNSGREMFLTCSSCDNAWLDYPLPPVKESMGELLAKQPEGGAIAVFAPTAGGVTGDHEALVRSLYEGMYQHGLQQVGPASLFAHLGYYREREDSNLIDQFVLIGDPATRLALPKQTGELKVEPEYVDARRGGSIKLEYTLEQPVWGWAQVTLASARTGREITATEFRVRSGTFVGEIPIPPNSTEEQVQITALVYNKDRSVAELATGTFEIGRPRLRWKNPKKYIPKKSEGNLTDLGFQLTLVNESPLPIEEAELTVNERGSDRQIFQRRYSFEPGQERIVTFRYPAPVGLYPLSIKLLPDNDENAAVTYTPVATIYNPDAKANLVLNPAEPLHDVSELAADQWIRTDVTIYNIGGMQTSDAEGVTAPANLRYRLALYNADTNRVISNFIETPALASGHAFNFELSVYSLPEEGTPLEIRLTSTEWKPGDPLLGVYPLDLPWRDGPDLVVDPESLRFRSAQFREGNTVFIRGIVRNDGDVATGPFKLAAYRDVPWVRENELRAARGIFRPSEESLGPGESREVELRWDGFQNYGSYPVYLVANADKKITEEDFTNNLAFSTLRMESNPDLELGPSLQLSRETGERGDPLQVTARVKNLSDVEIGDIPVVATLASAIDGVANSEARKEVVTLAPKEEKEITFEFTLPPGAQQVSVTANPGKRIDENNFGNNNASATLYSPADMRLLSAATTSDAKQVVDLAPLLFAGRFSGTQLQPNNQLVTSAITTAIRKRHDFDPEMALINLPPDTRGLPADQDNRWTMEEGLLEAHPSENCEPIRLAIPVETGRAGWHHVRMWARTTQDYESYPASVMRLRVEAEPEFKTFDFIPMQSHPSKRLVDVGVYNLGDDAFDVLIDDATESAWTTIYGFEFRPAGGVYESAPMPVDALKKMLRGSHPHGLQWTPSCPMKATCFSFIVQLNLNRTARSSGRTGWKTQPLLTDKAIPYH
jgi:hypothetical protein